jgi:hypothetical protein
MTTAMSAPASSTPLRRLLETHLEQLSSDAEKLFQEFRERGRRELADQLNQVVRRIRQSPDLDELGIVVADVAASFAGGAAWFRIEGQVARCQAVRGVAAEDAEKWRTLEVSLETAAALKSAAETCEPVVAAAAASEVSPELLALHEISAESRVSLFPVVAGETAVAVVYAWGNVQGPVLEILALVAAGVWTELSKPAPAELVQIAPAPVAEAETPAQPEPAFTWDQLSPDEQQVHLRAQRFARVRVAEMRLQDADDVQSGRTRRNVYERLKPRIDAARNSFRSTYFASCPSMVDYLHLELVRTLANDDAELLGADYPGPMV